LSGDRLMFKKKILFISDRDGMDRRSDAVFGLVSGMDRDRFQPVFLDLSDGVMAGRMERAEIDVAKIEINPELMNLKEGVFFRPSGLIDIYRSLPVIGRTAALLKETKPAAVYTASALSHIVGAVAGRLAGVKVVWHFRDYIRPPMSLVFTSAALWGPSKIVCNTNLSAGQFGNSSRVVVVPDGVDMEIVRTRRRWESVRDTLGAPLDARVVCAAPSSADFDTADIFMEAAALTLKKTSNIHFIFAADFYSSSEMVKEDVEAVAEDIGIAEHVTVAQVRDDRYDIIDTSDVYVCASCSRDSDALEALDAMALGKPIVATRCGAIPELIRHGESGIIIPPGNSAAMAGALVEMLENPDVTKVFGENADATVRERHMMDSHIRRIEDILWRL